MYQVQSEHLTLFRPHFPAALQGRKAVPIFHFQIGRWLAQGLRMGWDPTLLGFQTSATLYHLWRLKKIW